LEVGDSVAIKIEGNQLVERKMDRFRRDHNFAFGGRGCGQHVHASGNGRKGIDA
jgi:hypothetical protein